MFSDVFKNVNFPSYADYVKLQVSKVNKDGQKKKGGLSWEYNIQKQVKPDLVDWVKRFKPPEDTSNILVLGARWGADVLFLKEGGYSCPIVAIDLYDPPLSELVQTGDAHYLNRCGISSKSIQLIWAYHVIEHLWSPSRVLHSLLTFSDKNTKFLVALPSFDSRDKYDAQDEYANKNEWEALLFSCGWRILAYDERLIKNKKLPAHFYILVPNEAQAYHFIW